MHGRNDMTETIFQVCKVHKSGYPEPIRFGQGTELIVETEYTGNENWKNWFFCHAPGQKPGWVPKQVFNFINKNHAIACADYTAKELDVAVGDKVAGRQILNGWVWCRHLERDEEGWVPLENLEKLSI